MCEGVGGGAEREKERWGGNLKGVALWGEFPLQSLSFLEEIITELQTGE